MAHELGIIRGAGRWPFCYLLTEAGQLFPRYLSQLFAVASCLTDRRERGICLLGQKVKCQCQPSFTCELRASFSSIAVVITGYNAKGGSLLENEIISILGKTEMRCKFFCLDLAPDEQFETSGLDALRQVVFTGKCSKQKCTHASLIILPFCMHTTVLCCSLFEY